VLLHYFFPIRIELRLCHQEGRPTFAELGILVRSGGSFDGAVPGFSARSFQRAFIRLVMALPSSSVNEPQMITLPARICSLIRGAEYT
jgi:hypothetical protein